MTIRPKCVSVTFRYGFGAESGGFCNCWGAHASAAEQAAIDIALVEKTARIESPSTLIFAARLGYGETCGD